MTRLKQDVKVCLGTQTEAIKMGGGRSSVISHERLTG